jgi:hypothetical protein
MFGRRVVECDPVPVFDDTASFMKVPVSHDVLCPVYPLVNENFWCGDGRWTAYGDRQFWGRRDDNQ